MIHDITRRSPVRRIVDSRVAFTLVEMLVAMAVTLLMMAALTRAFALVGERIRDGRGRVQLSNQLRDVTTRLRDELNRCTVSLAPNNGGVNPPGYLLYYEGPMTNATSSIFLPTDTIDSQVVVPQARYGDLDDYLAFTAIAEPGTWFTGKVPLFILSGVATDTDPLLIRSKYAEIVYFTNPDRDSSGAVVDADSDGLPDRLLLYRRVFLIRPDLNLNSGALHNLSAGTDWQTGMADVHQLCDLSVRRMINSSGTLDNTTIVANSLDDLAKPHNRFGHVRVPVATLAGSGTGTSMPILALEPPVEIIANASTTSPSLRPADTSSGNANVVTESRWSGFLRREFILTGDRQGEDVLLNHCRALDLQILDPKARFVMTSANLVVGPSDVGYREALRDTSTTFLQGGFVDLAYPVLAGGPIRGWRSTQLVESDPASNDLTAAPAVAINIFQTPFSGINSSLTSIPTTVSETYSDALLLSGRVAISGGEFVLFQPAFDTYSSYYERDGFPQDRRYAPGIDHFLGTIWRNLTASTDPMTLDLGADGLDNNDNLDPGADDPRERETSAPFTDTPKAIRVTVRIENPATRQIHQASVVHRDEF